MQTVGWYTSATTSKTGTAEDAKGAMRASFAAVRAVRAGAQFGRPRPRRVARADDHTAYEAWKVPGVIVGIWKRSEPSWTAAFGVSDLATRTQMAVDDYMRIGSITKTSLSDLSRYVRPLAKGSLVSAGAQEMRLAGMDLRGGARHPSYGFAIANIGGAIGHNGSLPGYQGFAGYLPDKDTTVIVLTNLYQTRNGNRPADELAGLIIDRLERH